MVTLIYSVIERRRHNYVSGSELWENGFYFLLSIVKGFIVHVWESRIKCMFWPPA